MFVKVDFQSGIQVVIFYLVVLCFDMCEPLYHIYD